jgi:hypothetical protein
MLPDPPKKLDMKQRIHVTEADTILRQHFAHRPDVLVSGDGYLCNDTRIKSQRRANWLVPDCIVAFGVDPDAILDRNGYVITEVGKPPDFVLEIASESTGQADYTRKRDLYAGHGVGEYWRFDPTGGQYHDQPIAGDLLVEGVYRPIALNYGPDGVIWGHSPMLGLDLCWENGRLRFYDPSTGEYLRSMAEVMDERDAAERRADNERTARQAAENRAEDERAARQAAEAEAQQLREQLQRLQEGQSGTQ